MGAGFADGETPDVMIRDQVRVLNDSYNGRTGGANTGFGFELAGITRTENATWFTSFVAVFNVELEAKTTLERGGPGTLNIDLVDADPPHPRSRTSTASSSTGARFRADRSPSTAKATSRPTKSATGSACTTRSRAAAARRETSSMTRHPSSRPRSTAPSAATHATASRASTRSATSWTTPRIRACSNSRPDRPIA